MVKDFKFFRTNETIRWRTANGLDHRLENISTDHIVSIVRCMNGDGNIRIPNPYEGRTHIEWVHIFHNELERRRN